MQLRPYQNDLVERLKSNMDRFIGLDLYQIESDIIAFKIQYG